MTTNALEELMPFIPDAEGQVTSYSIDYKESRMHEKRWKNENNVTGYSHSRIKTPQIACFSSGSGYWRWGQERGDCLSNGPKNST